MTDRANHRSHLTDSPTSHSLSDVGDATIEYHNHQAENDVNETDTLLARRVPATMETVAADRSRNHRVDSSHHPTPHRSLSRTNTEATTMITSTTSEPSTVTMTAASTICLMLKAALVMICRLWLASLIVYTIFIMVCQHQSSQQIYRNKTTDTYNSRTGAASSPGNLKGSTHTSAALSSSSHITEQSAASTPTMLGITRDIAINVKVVSEELQTGPGASDTLVDQPTRPARSMWVFPPYKMQQEKVAIPALFGSVLPRVLVAPLLVVPSSISACSSNVAIRKRHRTEMMETGNSESMLLLPAFPVLAESQRAYILKMQAEAAAAEMRHTIPAVVSDDAGEIYNSTTVVTEPKIFHPVKPTVRSRVTAASKLIWTFLYDAGVILKMISPQNRSHNDTTQQNATLAKTIRSQHDNIGSNLEYPLSDTVSSEEKTAAHASTVESVPIQWACLVARGGCPFDEKVYNLQQHGCSAVLVYNNITGTDTSGGIKSCPPSNPNCQEPMPKTVPDLHVRMSAHSMHTVIRAYSMFLTYSDVQKLISRKPVNTQPVVPLSDTAQPLNSSNSDSHDTSATQAPLIIKMSPTEYGYSNTHRHSPPTLSSLLFDMLLLLASVFICGSCFLILCLILSIARNIVIFGRFYLQETIIEGSMIILSQGQYSFNSNVVPAKLASIPFPVRILGVGDMAGLRHSSKSCLDVLDGCANSAPTSLSWNQGDIQISRDCCAICLDDFVVGSRVRELPCRHIFHSLCIDPWLLKHNRLCPICKRDVLVSRSSSLEASPSHPATGITTESIAPETTPTENIARPHTHSRIDALWSWVTPVRFPTLHPENDLQSTLPASLQFYARSSSFMGYAAVLIPLSIATPIIHLVSYITVQVSSLEATPSRDPPATTRLTEVIDTDNDTNVDEEMGHDWVSSLIHD
ncbi:hypothetical protein BASA50_008726 [Batrachochytrium salamandrivorans]|uniref:RING-type E3 ubiquitin transferase n=1 Tax=Batrachochytrium salamandrivorans TaxID=1357716 RepID=A0ABQ8F3E8_9FUNG|nr:hypothetical protein BASA50_008726 [Batrachochytrium salamandrivorans]